MKYVEIQDKSKNSNFWDLVLLGIRQIIHSLVEYVIEKINL